MMANKIKELAKAKKIKMVELCEKAGISRTQLYDIVNQNSVPTITTARKIANVLDITIDELFPNTSLEDEGGVNFQ